MIEIESKVCWTESFRKPHSSLHYDILYLVAHNFLWVHTNHQYYPRETPCVYSYILQLSNTLNVSTSVDVPWQDCTLLHCFPWLIASLYIIIFIAYHPIHHTIYIYIYILWSSYLSYLSLHPTAFGTYVCMFGGNSSCRNLKPFRNNSRFIFLLNFYPHLGSVHCSVVLILWFI